MARINSDLFTKLEKRLGLGRARIYELIDEKVRETHLPRHLSAIALASERGINISKYAGENDLATIRQAAITAIPKPVSVPNQQPVSITRHHKSYKRKRSSSTSRRRGNTVFVVHGRNDSARKALYEFLRAIGLKPLEWTQLIKKTKKGSPYVGDVLEAAFRDASAVIVLLTPDDQAQLKKEFRQSSDPYYERRLTGQARPNVLFEAGMAFGKNPNSTVLVKLGDVRPFSDIAGRHVVHLSNQTTSRQELAIKLANAGCNVDTSGTDWLSVGDFEIK